MLTFCNVMLPQIHVRCPGRRGAEGHAKPPIPDLLE